MNPLWAFFAGRPTEPETAPTQTAEEGPMPVDEELQDSYADAYYECPMDSRELLAAEGIDDDFAWEGRGAMYDQRAPMVIWSDRIRTSVPYIAGSNGGNAVEFHAKRIADAASNLHKKLCGLALVDHDYSDGWMAEKIRPKLAECVVVLVCGEPYKEVPMSCEGLFTELHVSENAEVVAYDLEVGYPNPMPLRRFIKNLDDPAKIQAVLSHQTPFLDDGYAVGWGSLSPYSDRKERPFLVDEHRAWVQLFHPLYHQYGARSPEGQVACFKVLSGALVFIINSGEGAMGATTREDVLRAMEGQDPGLREKWESRYEAYSRQEGLSFVLVRPGCTILLPPTVFYECFAPVATVAVGSFFYNLDCLHLTDVARLYNATYCTLPKSPNALAYYTLVRIMAHLPATQPRPIGIKSLTSLSSMIISPWMYAHPNYSDAHFVPRSAECAIEAYIGRRGADINCPKVEAALDTYKRRGSIPAKIASTYEPTKAHVLLTDEQWAVEFAWLVQKSLRYDTRTLSHTRQEGGFVFKRTASEYLFTRGSWYESGPVVEGLCELLAEYQKNNAHVQGKKGVALKLVKKHKK